jgi:hypothetical protein
MYNFVSILKEILEYNPEIKRFSFNLFPSNRLLQKQRSFNDSEKKQLEKALTIRNEFGFSFWESLMSTFQNNSKPNFELIENALFHNENTNVISFDSNDIGKIEEYIKKNYLNNLAFLSIVSSDNIKNQLPLIDFHIKPTKINQDVVEHILNKLQLNSGFLVNSGESYHFISKELVSQEQLELLLAKLIFYTPIVDRNWVAHQLIEKKCALRITKGNKQELELVKKY